MRVAMRACVERWVLICFFPSILSSVAGLLCCDCAKAAPPDPVSQQDTKLKRVACEVKLADPAFATKPARACHVVQFRDRNGFPVEYALSFETDVCFDKKCKTIEVTMFWDAMGYYKRLEFPPDKPLTKKEHEPFDAKDYAKLDRILKDRNAILGRYSLAFLAKPATGNKDIDGWTGATPATVQESVVKDAAYTTWVMWRWANGEIVSKLRGLTEQSCTPRFLKQMLQCKDRRQVDFALKYVIERSPDDAQFLEEVFHVLENGDREHVALAIEFLNKAMKDEKKLHARLIESCCRMNNNYSPIVLDYFAVQQNLPPATMEGLTGCLGRLPYFQVHLILKLLEKKAFSSAKTNSDISKLLDSDDFFIARRACEHLMKQPLDSDTEGRVRAFRKRQEARNSTEP